MRLTAEQRAAASVAVGAVRVVAGPGTGKTAVITERFRRLVQSGVPAESILVLTFTERAAAEMRSRIAAAIDQEPPHVGTFHALAMRWLREDGRLIGVHPAFSILEGADRWIELRELMWELGSPALVGEARPDDLVGPLLRVMERLKQELVPLARLEAWCRTTEDRERAALFRGAIELFRAFERQNRARLRLDFDDVLVAAVRLFETRPEVLARYRDRFRHLMVDEYQDTDMAQERLVELLGAGGGACVVGDDDQSIYRFRGASLESMERFLRVFPDAQTITLGQNRRSTGSIVAAAGALIAGNADRIPKDLVASGHQGAAVTVIACPDEAAEARAISDEVERLRAEGAALASIAVLCRTNAVARPVVDALTERGIPARHWGAQGLYALPAVRDALAMLRVLLDAGDVVSLARLLDRLGGGIQAGVRQIGDVDGLGETALDRLAGWAPAAWWASALVDLRPLTARLGAADLFFELMTRTAYLEGPGIDADAVAAVTRLGEVIAEFCERSSDQSLGALLRRLDLVLLSGYDEEVPVPDGAAVEDAVQVMTIHQAKGLEFDTVFVPAMVEGRLPQPHRGEGLDLPPAVLEASIRGREDHVAEERRLAYVAMTRARRRLFLSWAERYEGTRAWRRSRFVAEALESGRVEERCVKGSAVAAVEAVGSGEAAASAAPALSFSAIAAYRECPRQHWFRYHVRLPAPQSVEAQYGTVMHEVLMRAGAQRQRGAEVRLADLEKLLDEAWAQVSFADPRRAPALRALARRQLAAFHAAGGVAIRPEMVERSFTTDLDSWRLRGIIDRVDRLPPPTLEGGEVGFSTGGGTTSGRRRRAKAREGWRLVDYKTGSALPASRLRRDLQLALYALGAREGLGLEGRLELEIVYLKDGRHVVIPATEALLEEARRVGGEVASSVAAGRFEPRPERRRCGLCAYRLACDAAR